MENSKEKNKSIFAEEAVFDRVEQSFKIFKNNFFELFLPLFLYTSFTVVIFSNVSKYYGMDFMKKLLDHYKNNNLMELLNYDSQAIISMYIYVILIVIYLTLYIPFLLSTIKGIKQSYFGEKVTTKENIIYGFKNLIKSFETYWFIFAYVALIPALIGIIGGGGFIFGSLYEISNLKLTGGIISGFSIILLIIFSIYRGVKSKFAISSAIDKNEFTKPDFNFSVKVTNSNWWRIVGNFLLLGIIISLIGGIFNQVIGLSGSSFDYSSLLNIKEKPKPEEIMNVVNQTVNSYSPILNFFKSILENIVNITGTVFTLIFTYIFFKRLEIENNLEKKDI